jgi:hypothetical protein
MDARTGTGAGTAALFMLAMAMSPARAGDVPLIDAHSQLDDNVGMERVVSVLNEAGISRVILSALRKGRRTREIIAAARQRPGLVTASIGLKAGPFRRGEPAALARVVRMGDLPAFGAISEVMVLHQQKGKVAPEIASGFDAPEVKAALDVASKRRWPLVVHLEFGFAAAMGRYERTLREFEQFVGRHFDLPVALTHMGQLGPAEARRLIVAHGNVYFLTSHANTLWIRDRGHGLPWTNLFAAEALAPEWRALILQYPDRFVLAFDNVLDDDWGERYVRQVKLWKTALRSLPPDVAHAVAHRNAERLWRLPAPARSAAQRP